VHFKLFAQNYMKWRENVQIHTDTDKRNDIQKFNRRFLQGNLHSEGAFQSRVSATTLQRVHDTIALRIHKHAISWRSLSRAPVEARILRSFSATVRCILYAYYVGRAKWKANRPARRVGRYPLELSRHWSTITSIIYRMVFTIASQASGSYMPDSVSFVCTNKVRVKEKNFLSARKRRNNINWCSMLSLSINAIRANWLSINNLRWH